MNGISVLDVATGAVTEIAKGSRRPRGVRFSPDSRWIAFNTSDVPGKRPLWVAPFHGAAPIPESEWIAVAGTGALPFWSPDGRWFHYATLSGPDSTEGVFHRQPFDPTTGRLSGPAVQLFSTEGRTLTDGLLNTVTATRDHIYLLFRTGQSDIWMMALPR